MKVTISSLLLYFGIGLNALAFIGFIVCGDKPAMKSYRNGCVALAQSGFVALLFWQLLSD